jgi:PAS domain S-box-containing protein
VRDVSYRVKIEEALSNEKRRFQLAAENAPFGIILIDKDGMFKYVNPRFKELFGYDLNDVPDGKTWFIKAHPDPEYRQEAISTWIEEMKGSSGGRQAPWILTITCKYGTQKVINFIPVKLDTGDTKLPSSTHLRCSIVHQLWCPLKAA